MKTTISLVTLLSLSSAFAVSSDFALKDLTSENRLIIKKNINATGKKTVYFQDGKIKAASKVNKKRLFCTLENIRDKVEPINLGAQTTFKFDNNDFVRTDNYIGIRIWKKHWLFGWDNGDVQVINCDDTAKFFNEGVTNTITYKEFKKVVGPYMEIK
jgi:hypothetical protein